MSLEQAARLYLQPLCEEEFAAAYRSTTPQQRACIKQTLALAQAVYGEAPFCQHSHFEKPALGFTYSYSSLAVPWVVMLMSQGFASAPRLASALMCARLAGVKEIFPVWLGDEACPPSLLCALELCGIEQAFRCKLQNIGPLLATLTQHAGGGRALNFASAQPETCLSILQGAISTGVPCWTDHAPHIGCHLGAQEPETIMEMLLWAHPDAKLSFVSDIPIGASIDAVYSKNHCQQTDMAPLCLSTDLAGCWLHSSLESSFFMQKKISAHSVRFESE